MTLLKSGEIIEDRWVVGNKIGEGTFSEIYEVWEVVDVEKARVYALKLEKSDSKLGWESQTMLALQDSNGDQCVPLHVHYGEYKKKKFLIMELLGESVSDIRFDFKSVTGHVPLEAAIKLGLYMLQSISKFHDKGYVHRDIKPSNFMRPRGDPLSLEKVHILDFGLCRILMSNNVHKEQRPSNEFRGTSLYASSHSHDEQDLSRRDDLWSLFYVILDLLRGVPWRDAATKNKDRSQCGIMKKEYMDETKLSNLLNGIEGKEHLLHFNSYLKSLSFQDAPDYTLLASYLKGVLIDNKLDVDAPLQLVKRVSVKPVKGSVEHCREWMTKVEHALKGDEVEEK